MAADVVLPFVALMTALPCGSRLGQQPDGVRLQPGEDLAGQRRPAAAARGADERADRLGGRHLRGQQAHGTSTRSARGRDPDGGRQRAERIAVRVGHERAVGLEGDLAAAQEDQPRIADVRAPEHPG